jgi:DNA ligase (NAD+)
MKLLQEFKDDEYDFIENVKISDLTKLIKCANDEYHNSDSPIMTDAQFDLLIDELKRRNPNHTTLKKIGAQVHSKKKVNLPYHMGSMNKVKPNTGAIEKWVVKYEGPYIYSDKLDGTSGLLVLPDKKLYTRGNGKVGTDISSLIPYINGIPKYDGKQKIVVRGELVISKTNFKKMEKEANKKFTNARSIVNGLVNKKSANKSQLKYVDFVTYEMIEPSYNISKQFAYLKKHKFIVVDHGNLKKLDGITLTKHLKHKKLVGKYDIDGIIVEDDRDHNRNVSGNPKYAFAYKDVCEIKKTTITQVEWRISKDKKLKPRIHVKAVVIDGVTITHVTGNNAKYIKENGIGKGTIIELVRSGEVIPYIHKVIKKVDPDFPTDEYSYKWNSTGVDIVIDKLDSNDKARLDLLVKNITYYLKKSGVKYVDESIVRKFIDAKLDTVPKLLNATNEDFMKVDGFKDRMAFKIYTNIQNSIKKIKLSTLMAASNLFGPGLGEKKLTFITNEHPDILDKKLTKTQMIELISDIDGFSTKTSTGFAEGLIDFKKFLKKIPNVQFESKKRKLSKNPKFEGMKIVFSGFRNKEWNEIIEDCGGKVTNTVSKNTNILVVKDKSETSSKIKKANELNVKIMNVSEFEKLVKK